MEGYVYQRIKLASVVRNFPFASRYKTSGERLVRSLAARGMLLPVTAVARDGGYIIVSGESRFLAALQLGWEEIPANLLSPELADKDLFLISVLSNWNERISELDAVFAVERAVQLQISEEIILDEILPALGLTPEKRWLDEASEISKLEPSLLEKVAGNKLPYRGIRSLSRFSREDQKYFAENLADKISLTSNQLLKASEWLFDLMKKNKSDLEAILAQPVFHEVLNPAKENKDLRQAAERFFEKLRCIRFPQQTEAEAKFKEAAAPLAPNSQIKNGFWLEAPQQFEEAGIMLHARLRDPKALEKLQQSLEKHRNLVNSLFDIML